MVRQEILSLSKQESTTLSRNTAFNILYKADQFLDNLKPVLDCYKITIKRLYNIDETEVTTVMKPVKACKKQISQAASAERDELVTLLAIQ